MQVKIEGVRRLRRELKRAGVDLADLREVNLNVARTVTTAAVATTPNRTGRLQGSVRPGASRTSAVVRAGGARVPYAGVIHWGWPARNITAQPWLSDAATATEPAWTEHYMRELDRLVASIAGGPR